MSAILINGMSNETYHAHPAFSSSQLKDMERTPAHFYAKHMTKGNKKAPTDSMVLGTLVHTLLLEDDKFESEFAIAPKFDRRTKQGKADAQKAGLWGKAGTWQQYPKRMMKNRARAFALRDKFADVLSGFGITEEEKDRVIDEVKAPKDITPKNAPQGLNALVNNAVVNLSVAEDAVDVAKLADDIAKAENNDKLANLATTISKHRDAGKISDAERLELINAYKKRSLYLSLTNDVKQATLDSGNEVRALLHSKRASLSEEDFATLDSMLDDVLNRQAGV